VATGSTGATGSTDAKGADTTAGTSTSTDAGAVKPSETIGAGSGVAACVGSKDSTAAWVVAFANGSSVTAGSVVAFVNGSSATAAEAEVGGEGVVPLFASEGTSVLATFAAGVAAALLLRFAGVVFGAGGGALGAEASAPLLDLDRVKTIFESARDEGLR